LSADRDFRLEPGMLLAIETVLTAGRNTVRVQGDGWTVETADGQPSVHFEHTVALTPNGPEVLTAEVGQPAAN
jgi:methionyl aminopeptidase